VIQTTGQNEAVKLSRWNYGERKMDVAMMQPTFLPWQGFFELIYEQTGLSFLMTSSFQFKAITNVTDFL
jgi:hypothetical protein